LGCLKELGLDEIPSVACHIFKRDTNIAECSCQCSMAGICSEFKMFKYITKKCFNESCALETPCLSCIETIHKAKALIMVLQAISGYKDNIRYRSLKYMNMIDGSEHKYYQKRLVRTVKSLRKRRKDAKSKQSTFKF